MTSFRQNSGQTMRYILPVGGVVFQHVTLLQDHDGSSVQVWEAVKELRSEGTWAVESIRQVAPAFEAKLAAGQPHDLPALVVPTTPSGVPADAPPIEVWTWSSPGWHSSVHYRVQEACSNM